MSQKYLLAQIPKKKTSQVAQAKVILLLGKTYEFFEILAVFPPTSRKIARLLSNSYCLRKTLYFKEAQNQNKCIRLYFHFWKKPTKYLKFWEFFPLTSRKIARLLSNSKLLWKTLYFNESQNQNKCTR